MSSSFDYNARTRTNNHLNAIFRWKKTFFSQVSRMTFEFLQIERKYIN